MTKGFLTLATGDEKYFKLAENLLKSYKLHSENPLPFAILTDRQNKYTKEFDEVIIIKESENSYMDKLSILLNTPFDQTVFIDADCLAYKDLNQYWDIYDFRYTLSCFGNSYPLDYRDGWFKREDVGKFAEKIKFIPNMHGGCYFINKSDKCKEFYDLALEINKDYQKYTFKHFEKPADEPILALCMAVFDCRPIVSITQREIIFYPVVKNLKADIISGKNSCHKLGKYIENAFLIHWQNYFTKTHIYKTEIYKLKLLESLNPNRKKINDFHKIKIKLISLYYKNTDNLFNIITALNRMIKK